MANSNEIAIKGKPSMLERLKPEPAHDMPVVGDYLLAPDSLTGPFCLVVRIEHRTVNDREYTSIYTKEVSIDGNGQPEQDERECTINKEYICGIYHTFEELRDAYRHVVDNATKPKPQTDAQTEQDDMESSELVLRPNNVEKTGIELYKTEAELARQQQLLAAYLKMEQNKLDRIRTEMRNQIAVVKRKITRFERLVHRIELYSGVEEEIVMLQDGAPADVSEPICLHQEVLYMDEEVGDWKDQGISFENIEDFDEWLLRDHHLDLFVSKKGLRVFGVRREEKRGGYENQREHRVYNPFLRFPLNFQNEKTYIVARNGDKVYRIWADVVIRPLLFPSKDDFQKLLEQKSWTGREMDRKEKREQMEDFVDKYSFSFYLIQGLLDRSDVFAPHPKIDLFGDVFNNPAIRFIYDAENKRLPGEFEEFWPFVKRINADITEGSRIIFYKKWAPYGDDRFDKRFQNNYNRRIGETWGLPDKPKSGLYTLKCRSTGELCIFYNPKDRICHGWSWRSYDTERKCNLSYEVHPTDVSIINYDALTPEIVEFYLNNRINRRDYLEIMPMLAEAKKALDEEVGMERAFIMMVKSATHCDDEPRIAELIKRWKLKNKVKRPITSNDTLAFKQICAWIKSGLN